MRRDSARGAPRLLSPARATALFLAATIAAPQAQVIQGSAARHGESPATAVSAPGSDADTSEVNILVGRSAVLNVAAGITRISLTSSDIADAMVTSQQQLLVHGKAPGTISMFVWDRAGGIRRYEVNVQRDLGELSRQIRTLFPGEPITVSSNGRDVVIAGSVSSKYVVEKAADVAAGYVEKKENVVNLLKQQDGVATEQVLLRVRFAEISRNAMTELGVSLFSDGRDGRFARTTTQQFAAPFFDVAGPPTLGQSLVFSDYLNLFLFDAKNQLGGVIRALQNRGLFQSLAEPNLVAENGKEASFLAGGEYPYPVVQAQGGGTSVTIQFKEYGIKLNFTPTIVGSDLVKLKVRPEVSSLDFSNALVIEGFRIPALQTRRTETEIELQDGQTFAIAGLMSNTVATQLRKVPGIGDIPVLGLLFRSKAAEKGQTELVVMITPQILRRNSTGVSPTLPNIVEPYLGAPDKSMPAPAPWSPGQPQGSAQPPSGPAAPGTPAASAPVHAGTPSAVETPPAPLAREVQKQARELAKQQEREEKAAAEQLKIEQKRAAEQAKADAKLAEQMRKADAKRAEEQRKADEKRGVELAKQQEAARRAAEQEAKDLVKLEKELQRRQAEASNQHVSQQK
jgi:pilus assembly protein CpaC